MLDGMIESKAEQAAIGPSLRARWERAVLPGDFQLGKGQAVSSPRDRLVDWAVFVVSVAIGTLILLDQKNQFWIVNALFGAVACVALFWRRTHPLSVGLIVAVASCLSGAAGTAWLVVMYNSALRLDRRGLVPVLSISLLGFVTWPLMYPPEEGLVTAIVLCFGVAGLALGLGALARARRNQVMALVAAAEVAEGEQRLREQQVRVAERHRIAREMHDVLAHRISLLSLHAGALEYRKDASPEEISQAASVIRASAQAALQELRDVIGVMRTHADEGSDPPQPELGDIPALVEKFETAGLSIEVNDELSGAEDISPTAGRALYRVVQEGLTNASKHAPGAAVRVDLVRCKRARVAVLLENELAGGSSIAAVSLESPGVGLVGLRERVELIGGVLEHSISDGSRFRLHAEVPFSDA